MPGQHEEPDYCDAPDCHNLAVWYIDEYVCKTDMWDDPSASWALCDYHNAKTDGYEPWVVNQLL